MRSNAARGFQRDDLANFPRSKSSRPWRCCPQRDIPVESCPVPCNWRLAAFAVVRVTFGAGRSWGETSLFATSANACADPPPTSPPSRAGILIWRAAGLLRRQRCGPVRAAVATPATEPLSAYSNLRAGAARHVNARNECWTVLKRATRTPAISTRSVPPLVGHPVFAAHVLSTPPVCVVPERLRQRVRRPLHRVRRRGTLSRGRALRRCTIAPKG